MYDEVNLARLAKFRRICVIVVLVLGVAFVVSVILAVAMPDHAGPAGTTTVTCQAGRPCRPPTGAAVKCVGRPNQICRLADGTEVLAGTVFSGRTGNPGPWRLIALISGAGLVISTTALYRVNKEYRRATR